MEFGTLAGYQAHHSLHSVLRTRVQHTPMAARAGGRLHLQTSRAFPMCFRVAAQTPEF